MNISNINAFRMELKMQGFNSSFESTKTKSADKNNVLDTEYKSLNATVVEFQMSIESITGKNTTMQSFADFFSDVDEAMKTKDGQKMKEYIEKEINPHELGYEGKPLTELTPEEAAKLIAEDGFFGINNTSSRVADFIIEAAKGNLDKLSQGREGLMKGFKMAEDLWGEKLPDISYDTLKETLKKVDENIGENGGNVLNKEA
jgi:hypothetical protein